MTWQVQPATADDDSAVVDFFRYLGLGIPTEYWERNFHPDAPDGARAIPLLARHENGTIGAMVAARPAVLALGERKANFCFFQEPCAPATALGAEAVAAISDHLQPRYAGLICIGPSAHGNRILDSAHWRPAVPVSRWCFISPQAGDSDAPAEFSHLPLPPELAANADICAALDMVFLSDRAAARTWQAQYPCDPPLRFFRLPGVMGGVFLREHPSAHPQGKEWHIVDLLVDWEHPLEFLQALVHHCVKVGTPAYLSLHAPHLDSIFREAGWTSAPPRWAFWWNLGLGQGREWAAEFLSHSKWFLSPMDLLLDKM